MIGWQPDVVCDNTHAQQITVHLRSIRPRKLAHVTDIFFSPSPPKNTSRQQRLLRFLFLKQATHAQQFQTPPDNNGSSGGGGGGGGVEMGDTKKLFATVNVFP